MLPPMKSIGDASRIVDDVVDGTMAGRITWRRLAGHAWEADGVAGRRLLYREGVLRLEWPGGNAEIRKGGAAGAAAGMDVLAVGEAIAEMEFIHRMEERRNARWTRSGL